MYNALMRAEILSVGTELLIGSTLNTNARFLTERLAERGVDVYHHVTVGDNMGRLRQALEQALGRAELVICSGGLGPTDDDITMEAAARTLGVARRLHRPTARWIRQRLQRARLPSSRLSLNQCFVPEGAQVFQNQNGTAPGVLLQTQRAGEKRWVLLLPGPPSELEPMFIRQAWPTIERLKAGPPEALAIRTLKIAGLTETQVAEKIGGLLLRRPPLTCGIYAKAGEVQLKIMSKAPVLAAARRAIRPVETFLHQTFGNRIFGVDDDTPASVVIRLLARKNLSVAVAESCTGGLIGHLLTEVPGSSKAFWGGVVAYHNRVKSRVLGVPEDILVRYGAVSAQTALWMAQGVRRLTGASIGIGVTGLAGPTGGTARKPVGLVYFAIVDSRGRVVEERRFTGQRAAVKAKSARAVLDRLRLRLLRS